MTRQEAIDIGRNDLLKFGRLITPKMFYLKSPKFHEEIAEIIMDREKRQILIEAPRGTGKSSIAVITCLHHAIYDKGDKFIILQSKTRPEAIRRLRKIKNILEYGQNFREIYGYCGQEVATIWREDEIQTTIGAYRVTIKALGTGQPMRGLLEDDTRVTLYYLDDPDDEDNTKTKESMEHNFDKFLGNKAGLDNRNGRVIVIGTPIRQGCIVELLRGTKSWETRHYEIEDEEGNLLWAEMYPKSRIEALKEEHRELGKMSKFYSEYMCKIVGEEDQLFKDEYLQYWDGRVEISPEGKFLRLTHLNGVEIEERIVPVTIFMGVDPASSVRQTADFSVVMLVAYDKDRNIYVLSYYRKRVSPVELANKILDLGVYYKPEKAGIETVGYQEMLRDYIRQEMDARGFYISGFERHEGFKPRQEKSSRLEQLHPFFYNRKVYLRKEMNEFRDELLMYPRGKHEDTIDSFYYATRRMYEPEHAVKVEKDELKYFLNTETEQSWMAV